MIFCLYFMAGVPTFNPVSFSPSWSRPCKNSLRHAALILLSFIAVQIHATPGLKMSINVLLFRDFMTVCRELINTLRKCISLVICSELARFFSLEQ